MERSRGERPPAQVPSDGSGVLADDTFGRALARWVADAAVDEAARARVRARWLRIQAEEEASLAGTLVDLAERRQAVVLQSGPQQLRGTIVGVGSDFVALRGGGGQQLLVATAAIDAVRTAPGGGEVRGDRQATLDVSLADVLVPVAADRPEVLVRTVGDATVRGELRAVGSDVLRLRGTGEGAAPCWIPIASVRTIALDPG